MIQYLQDKLTDHFNKIMLAVLYIGTVGLVVHLIHKSDAGGSDQAFILWATNTSSLIIGRLLGMMPEASNGQQKVGGTSTAGSSSVPVVTQVESTQTKE